MIRIEEELTDIELQKKQMEVYLSLLEKSAVMIDEFIPVVEKFDNKVYNVKFKNTLDNIARMLDKCWLHLEFTTSKFELEIDYSHIDYSISYPYTNYQNETDRRTSYLPSGYYDVRIGYMYNSLPWDKSSEEYKSFYSPSEEHYFYIDKDRSYNLVIQSAKIIAILKEYKDSILQKIADLKKEVDNIEETIADINRIKKEVETFNHNTSCTVRDFFNLKSYATWQ